LEELSAELFDPVAQTFTPTNGPAVDRLQAMLVPVSTASDEELMMLIWGSLKNMGGLPPVISSDVELFDPNVPTFRTPPEKLPSGLNSIAQIGKQRAVALLPNGTDVRVVATGFVAGTSTPQPAVYYSTSANGVSCTSGTTCASSFCVDGVCCDQGCAEQCQACDVKGSVGKCAPVIGTPHGIRQKCVEGTDPICGKDACDGITTAACTFTPPRTSCGKECKNALFIPHGCDGAGKCISDLPGQCPGGFACADATSCATTCAVDTDCAIGFACFGGKCENGAVCMDDHTVQTVQGHQTCEPYQCRADDAGANATCLLMCQSVSDCVAPNICDLSGACVPPPIATTAGCSVEPGDSHCEGRVPFAVVALALALTISRRNARRSVTASQKPAGRRAHKSHRTCPAMPSTLAPASWCGALHRIAHALRWRS
jgi:hypothetical protein